MGRILYITAVNKEKEAVARSVRSPVHTCGFGPVQAAVRTASLLAVEKPDMIVNAGIAGAYPGRAQIGSTVLARSSVLPELGAEKEDGFLPVTEMGFGRNEWPGALDLIKEKLPFQQGQILTVMTAAGTEATCRTRMEQWPEAAAEAMEGAGAAAAAAEAGIPFLELRTISNTAGPRSEQVWKLDEALDALAHSCRLLEEVLQP
ncbi:futalosine hydrolase [Alkalicoccus chagannorensis]|uniref:futalosine hydrolase n=1 Tax=Alkalicoccus chagannorensis TaxID=427072 RepID=UPI00040390B9|nr:futalosine hydrolase [Alkalicoccus chagannorensis]